MSNAYNMRRNAHQIEKGWQEIISYRNYSAPYGHK